MKKDKTLKKITMYLEISGNKSEIEVDVIKLTRKKVTIREMVYGDNCEFDRKTGEMVLTRNQKRNSNFVFAFGARRWIMPV